MALNSIGVVLLVIASVGAGVFATVLWSKAMYGLGVRHGKALAEGSTNANDRPGEGIFTGSPYDAQDEGPKANTGNGSGFTRLRRN